MSAPPATRSPGALEREELAAWVAEEIPRGTFVNLGIGLPTLVANFLAADADVVLHSENGILGFGKPPPEGEEDPDLIDAGKRAVTLMPGGSFFDQSLSFAMIRGGHVDLSVIGAYQVSAAGDFANWIRPDEPYGSVGGAMDLAAGARETWVVMPLLDRSGEPKLVARCTYPLTGVARVTRLYTDHGLFEGREGEMRLTACAPNVSTDEIRRVVPWAVDGDPETARTD